MAVPPFKVKARYDYTSQEEDDLKFNSNQVITVTDEEDADWYYGEYEDESGAKFEGLFPKNFVQILEPEAPPRPARSNKSKREHEAAGGGRNNDPSAEPSSVPKEALSVSQTTQSESRPPDQALAPIPAPQMTPEQPREPAPTPVSASISSNPQTSAGSKPPPTTEKPSTNAFRDRINAFNKPAAPPVAPVKPGNLTGTSGSGFVKKPFVAPPPSKDAYVPPPREAPPQKIYRREEYPEPLGVDNDQEARPTAPQIDPVDQDEEQPKPTSLKDRIALLQKQQMEQAARHADPGQKKEKSRKPRRTEVSDDVVAEADQADDVVLEKTTSAETTGKRSSDAARKRRQSREETPKGSGEYGQSRDILSDGNDADQSGAGDTEEGEETSTGRDDSDGRPERRPSIPVVAAAQRFSQDPPLKEDTTQSASDDDGEDEDEHIDPEVKRRMEIRERMAKMSGGMGMAGMFGPPGGLPSKALSKKASENRKGSGNTAAVAEEAHSRAAPIPIMPVPSRQAFQAPEEATPAAEVAKEEEERLPRPTEGREPEDVPDVEEVLGANEPPLERVADRPLGQLNPQGRPAPPLPPSVHGRIPPPPPAERPMPPPPNSRPVPPPPRQLVSPSEGSESDDELSSHDRTTAAGDSSRPSGKEGPPLFSDASKNIMGSSSLSEATAQGSQTSPIMPDEPVSRSLRTHQASAANPSLPAAPQTRAPPPPPSGPPKRSTSGDKAALPERLSHSHRQSDEEITEYEGDYDTDIAPNAAHKDALRAHARVPSLGDDSIAGDSSMHQSGLPSMDSPGSSAPRAVPPPPPTIHPPRKRQSSEVPRGAPPPLPPFKQRMEEDEEYDPYKYHAPLHGLASPKDENGPIQRTPTVKEPESAYASPSQSQHRRLPSTSQMQMQSPSSSSSIPFPSTQDSRHSSEMHRSSTTIRRSGDMSRQSGEHYMASDLDLDQHSGWWAQPNHPPLALQNRRDIIYEIDESSTTRRGGKKTVSKEVYVLFTDYSQTQISVQFEATDSATPTKLEQKHEPPPRNLRQDQLEETHEKFGARIAESAKSREGSVIGDGTPFALPHELMTSLPNALRPVGVRAYGALVYANLANATVQQQDEIRPGDIVTFRNAKFGGHRGPMKSKYSMEVGKPDHVAIVMDWDGTKKKIRAWEQGRDGKKVKLEGFKFGDMKSGEVKVWRVMSRAWVGWESNS